MQEAGFRVDGSEAGLYLWATEGKDCWESMEGLAELGILAGPGVFYGSHSPHHVRLSLTAPLTAVTAAAERLRARVL